MPSFIKDSTYKVSASDGTTSTLVPAGALQPGAPTQIVLTFVATPAELTVVGHRVQIHIS